MHNHRGLAAAGGKGWMVVPGPWATPVSSLVFAPRPLCLPIRQDTTREPGLAQTWGHLGHPP